VRTCLGHGRHDIVNDVRLQNRGDQFHVVRLL
jgi:hypothetical protein